MTPRNDSRHFAKLMDIDAACRSRSKRLSHSCARCHVGMNVSGSHTHTHKTQTARTRRPYTWSPRYQVNSILGHILRDRKSFSEARSDQPPLFAHCVNKCAIFSGLVRRTFRECVWQCGIFSGAGAQHC